MIDVGARLKELMDERSITMYTLSKRSGVSWNTIKNFYARKTTPNIATLALLCNGLGITMAQFFETDSSTAYLTEEQQHLINRWDSLGDKEKRLISDMLDLLINKK